MTDIFRAIQSPAVGMFLHQVIFCKRIESNFYIYFQLGGEDKQCTEEENQRRKEEENQRREEEMKAVIASNEKKLADMETQTAV